MAEVAREFSIAEDSLYLWVRDEQRRMEVPSSTGDEPLSAAERQELMRLRREMAELEKDNAFFGKPRRVLPSQVTKQGRFALMELELGELRNISNSQST